MRKKGFSELSLKGVSFDLAPNASPITPHISSHEATAESSFLASSLDGGKRADLFLSFTAVGFVEACEGACAGCAASSDFLGLGSRGIGMFHEGITSSNMLPIGSTWPSPRPKARSVMERRRLAFWPDCPKRPKPQGPGVVADRDGGAEKGAGKGKKAGKGKGKKGKRC